MTHYDKTRKDRIGWVTEAMKQGRLEEMREMAAIGKSPVRGVRLNADTNEGGSRERPTGLEAEFDKNRKLAKHILSKEINEKVKLNKEDRVLHDQ